MRTHENDFNWCVHDCNKTAAEVYCCQYKVPLNKLNEY